MPAAGDQRQTPTRGNHRSASCPLPPGRLQESFEDLLHKLDPTPRRAVETAKGVLA